MQATRYEHSGIVNHMGQAHLASRMPARVAVIDVGTNTAKLLIADVGVAGLIKVYYDEEHRIRLGEAVNASQTVVEAALRRLKDVLLEFLVITRQHRVSEVVAVGTSASRDWPNPKNLQRWVNDHTGLNYHILTGEEEALWSHCGARMGLPSVEGVCATIDIGGGSTELVLSTVESKIGSWDSMPLGSMRIVRKCFRSLPPAEDDVTRARRVIRHALKRCCVDPVGATLVCGSQTGRLLLGLNEQRGTGDYMLHYSAVDDWSRRLVQMTPGQVLDLNPEQMEGRTDLFPAAVLILECVMDHYNLATCHMSPTSLRHGLALKAAGLERAAND